MSTSGPVGWLDEYFLKQAQDGSGNIQPARPVVQYTGAGVSVADDPTNNRTIVTITGGTGPSQGTTTVANGLNSDVATGSNGTLRLTGPNGPFSIGGFKPSSGSWTPGTILSVSNTTANAMTLVHEDASSTATNRINTQSGVPVTLRPGGKSSATFFYDGSLNRFTLLSVLESPLMVSAKDFCFADGVSADGANMNAALTAAAGGHLHIPAGTYYLDSVMTPSSTTRITGEGEATVLLTQYGMRIEAVNDVTVEHLKVNMLLPGVPTSGPASTTTSFQGIAILNGAQRITVQHCHVTNFSQFGIILGDFGTNNGCNDIRILHNVVDCTGMTTATLANDPIGIECFPKGSSSSFAVTPGLIIHGNTVLGPTTPNSILAGIKCSVENGVRVTNNFVNNIVLNTIPEGGIDILNSTGAVVQGNKVDNCTIGISVGSLQSGPSLVTTSECVIADNVVSGYQQYGVLLSLGINGLVIADNHFTSSSGTHGIYAGAWVNLVNNVTNLGGVFELTFTAAHGMTNGQWVLVQNVVTGANGYWQVTVQSTTAITLNGSSYVGGWSSGGSATTVYYDLNITGNRLNGGDIYVLGPAPGYVISNNLVNGGLIVATDHNGSLCGNTVTSAGGTAITITGNGGVCANNAVKAGLSSGIAVTGNLVSVSGNNVQSLGGVLIGVTGNDGTIVGNVCDGSNTSTAGIFGTGNRLSISGNIAISCTDGIAVAGTDCIISNNSCLSTLLYGIAALSGSNYPTITNNRIIDPNCGNTSLAPGIYLPDAVRPSVFGNHVENRSAAGKAYYGILYGGSQLLMRDNRFINMQTADVLSSTPGTTYTMSQETYVDGTTSTCPADTNEDTLKTVTFDAGSLGINGGLRMKATGSISGSGSSTKTLKLYVSTTPFTLSLSSVLTATWTIEATVFNNGTETSMAYEYKTWFNGALVTQASATASFVNEASSTVPVEVTAQKGNSGDTITCNLLAVERFQ